MVAPLVRFAVRRSLNDTRYVKVVKRRHATGVVARVYREVERDFKMLAPPVALHSAAPDVLAAAWMILRETLLARGVVDRAAKEAVATGVSSANSCPYCVDVHGMTLAAMSAGDLSALSSWARSPAGDPPFSVAEAPELVGVAVAFHYYNRMVNVFLSDSPFPAHVPESAKPKARQVLGGVLRPAGAGPEAGTSLDLLPAVPIPADLAWAAGNPVVASAFARAYAAVDAVRSVPESVRSLVERRLAGWDGTSPGISRAWLTSAVAGLPVGDRAAGRLALAVALASYQVDGELVAEFRGSDEALIEVAGWAAMAAARRASGWLASGWGVAGAA